MTLILKAHKVVDYFHTDCGEYLQGNGSLALPYNCSCGVWEYNNEKFEYELSH